MTRPISTTSADVNVETRESFQDSEKIAEDFKGYLSNKSLLKDPLRNGRTKVLYDRSTGDPTRATVNIWQEDVDKIPMVTPTFSEALVRGVVTNFRDENKRYIYLDYTFWPVDLQNSSTYPLKTAEEAYSDLQKGNSIVPFSTAKSGSFVSITNVYLAYFLSDQFTPYLQPVYVFEGQEFVGYVQAVKEEVIDNTNPQTNEPQSSAQPEKLPS
jgi:hypothetical protein